MTRSYTLYELASIVGGTLRGRHEGRITGVADVAEAGPGEATWISSEKYAAMMASSRAGVVLAPATFGESSIPIIECARLDKAVAALLGAFVVRNDRPAGRHPSAMIDASAELGENVYVGPHAVIEAGVRIGNRSQIHAGVFVGATATIGADCVLRPNVVVGEGCRLGDRVIIHPCSVIGADGFGYYFDQDHHVKIPHCGSVLIEDDVEIGACSCIDKSKFGNTLIGRGVKIDNLVQIAHNVRIGAHSVIAALTGIAGSVRAGDYSVVGGAVRISDNLEIGAGARMAFCAVVTKNIPPGLTVSGYPAQEHRAEMRAQASLRKLPDVLDRVRELVARVEKLEAATHDQS